MKEIIDGNNIQITYPEQSVWTLDRNVIIFESFNADSGFQVNIKFSNYIYINCYTETFGLVVDISEYNEIIKETTGSKLEITTTYNGNSVTNLFYNNSPIGGRKPWNVLAGKSIQGRSHGATRYIECEDNGSINSELFLPKGSALFNGNAFICYGYEGVKYLIQRENFSDGNIKFLDDDNPVGQVVFSETYKFNNTGETGSGDVRGYVKWVDDTDPNNFLYTYSKYVLRGDNMYNYDGSVAGQIDKVTDINYHARDFWRLDVKENISEYNVQFFKPMQMCGGGKLARIYYTDADGCSRHLTGKIISDTMTTDHKEFVGNSASTIYNTLPSRILTKDERTMRVGFVNIPREAYAEDILLNSNVYINGNNESNGLKAIPMTSSMELSSSDDTISFTMDFKIQA